MHFPSTILSILIATAVTPSTANAFPCWPYRNPRAPAPAPPTPRQRHSTRPNATMPLPPRHRHQLEPAREACGGASAPIAAAASTSASDPSHGDPAHQPTSHRLPFAAAAAAAAAGGMKRCHPHTHTHTPARRPAGGYSQSMARAQDGEPTRGCHVTLTFSLAPAAGLRWWSWGPWAWLPVG